MNKLNRSAFSLIEVTVAIVIISILAAVTFPQVLKKIDQSRRVAAKAQIETFIVSLSDYYIDNFSYPTEDEGLSALRVCPKDNEHLTQTWNGPYISKDIPLDPWKRPYIYRSPGLYDKFDIICYGKDGIEGGTGSDADIVSWKTN